MSKKTRKKSPKAASRGTARAQSGKSTKPVRAQRRPAKTGKANKSGNRTTKNTSNATVRASQKAHSKQLRSSTSARSAPPKPAHAGKPAATKSPAPSTLAPATHKSGLSEGAKAPAFRLPRDGGGTVSPSDYSGKKLVLFFYPRADTPGCTKEAIDFSRLSSAFAENQTAVLGISADAPLAQEAFRDKHQLSTPLVSDEQHKMLEAYGVWGEKKFAGKSYTGINRSTFIIDANGNVARAMLGIKPAGHAASVLESLP